MGKLDDFFLEFMPQKPHETNSAMHLEDQSCFQFSPSDIENTDTSNFDVHIVFFLHLQQKYLIWGSW